ncbi:CLM5 protein, partial [Chunga burmeisteri]|nr:CLM5 protein [Chunga burmeisteri]
MELRALLLLPLCFPGLRVQTPDAEERQLEGSTLYIQCPYNEETQYWHLKAWCRVRDYSCEPLVEISSTQHSKRVTKEKVTIEDYPTNRTVSITMTNLQAEDSGTYSCAYRYDRFYNYLPLKTISLSIFKELHKWELDSLSVQCPYSSLRYSTGTKAWCRTEGQTACKDVVRTDYPSTQRNSKALVDRTSIQDDTQKRTVTITMEKLQAQDTGTYLCVIYRGSHPTWKMEVRLSVSKTLAGTTLSGTAGTNQATPGKTPAPSSNVNTFILLSGVLSILFILAVISLITLGIRRRKQLQRQGNRQAEDTYDKPEHIYDKPEDTAQLDSTERMESPKDDSKDLKYVTLNFKSRLIPEDPLYCNVELSQAHRKPKDENVEYASIAFK